MVFTGLTGIVDHRNNPVWTWCHQNWADDRDGALERPLQEQERTEKCLWAMGLSRWKWVQGCCDHVVTLI